jgi:hypothetical protein
MNEREYAQFLIESEEYEPEFAGIHAYNTYNPTPSTQLRIAAALNLKDRISGPEVLLRHLPALLETHGHEQVLQAIHRKRGHILSIREAVRQSLKHLELLKHSAKPQQLQELFGMLLHRGVIRQSPQIALDYAEQFAKVLRVMPDEEDRPIVHAIWDIVCEHRALAPVLAFTPQSILPPHVSRTAIVEQTDADHVESDMVTPRRYIDPTMFGSCASAEAWHEKTLDPDHKDFGACTLLESEDGTPVGSIKWFGYLSMLGLRTVVDSQGRYTVMPGAVYKVSGEAERMVDALRHADARFARIRLPRVELQPVRALGDFWPGSPSYADYRTLIQEALRHPQFAKQG